jgi:hypothetical protein
MSIFVDVGVLCNSIRRTPRITLKFLPFSYKDVPVYASFDAQNHCEVSAKHASVCIHYPFWLGTWFCGSMHKIVKKSIL